MTAQTLDNTHEIYDSLILLAIFIRDAATIEQVEAMNEVLQPVNQAILQRLGPPPGTVQN